MKSGLLTTSRALAIGVVFAIVAVTAQNIANSSRPPETVQQEIKDRDKDSNGLTVSRPKIFDDSLLQQMLNAAEARSVTRPFSSPFSSLSNVPPIGSGVFFVTPASSKALEL